MIENMAMGSIPGKMEDSMLEIGLMENNMEKVFINKPMAKRGREFGMTARGSGG